MSHRHFQPSAALRAVPEEFTEVESCTGDGNIRFSIYRHERSGKYGYTTTLKTVRCIRKAAGWAGYTAPLMSHMVTECWRNGIISPRPYRLGQPHDSTTHTSVWALYAHYCSKTDRNPTDLLRRAYPTRRMEQLWTPQIWSDVLEWAQWEGTFVPDRWNTTNTAQLFRALNLLDAPFLVYLLRKKLPTATVQTATTSPPSDTPSVPLE